MPELPDVVIYIEALESRLTGQLLKSLHLISPFVLRSVTPPITSLDGLSITGFRRLGKQIVFCFENDLFMIIHLMVGGRLEWKEAGDKAKGRNKLAALDFPTGTLILTEAGSKNAHRFTLSTDRRGCRTSIAWPSRWPTRASPNSGPHSRVRTTRSRGF